MSSSSAEREDVGAAGRGVATHHKPSGENDGEPKASAAAAAVTDTLGDGMATGLGGVLYLINLMRHLDLPDCFEDGWALASRVGGWGILEVLARALLGPLGSLEAADPLWRALVELEGRRPGEVLGALVRDCDCFCLPAAWLRGLNRPRDSLWAWGVFGGRFRVWEPDRTLIVEARMEAGSAAGAPARFLQAYREAGVEVRLRPEPDPPATVPAIREADLGLGGLAAPLRRWVAGVLPFVRWRLRSALGLPEDGGAGLAESWLRVPGRLYVTPTHVDLVMRLDQIALPVRLAGLDRDPGWVPDLARVITFHFV